MVEDESKKLNQDSSGSSRPLPSLTIDYDLYQKYFDDSNLTEVQKREFLDALKSIILSFVDLGFGVHPAQQIEVAKRDKNEITAEVFGIDSSDMLVCDRPTRSQFKTAADGASGPSHERSR